MSMQDKHKMDFDPDLMDRGWELMQAQLDKHMPEKKKRRFFPWFWPLLFVTSTSFAAFFMLPPFTEKEHKREVKEEAQKQEQKRPIAEYKQTDLATEVVTLEEASVQQFAKKDLAKQTVNAASSQVVKTQKAKVESKANNDVVEQVDLPTDPKLVSTTNEQQEVKVNHAIAQNNEALEQLENPIALLEYDAIDNKAIDKLGAPQLKSKKPVKWNYGIRANLSSSFKDNYQALDAGLFVERKLSKNLLLNAALSYERQSRNLLLDKFNAADSSLAEEASNNAPTGGSYNIDYVYSELDNRKLNISLGATVPVFARWRIGLALQSSYFLSSKVVVNAESGLLPTYDDVDRKEVDVLDSTIDLYDSPSIASQYAPEVFNIDFNKWQWSAMFLAEYRLSNRLSAQASLKRNITKWPSKEHAYGGSFYGSLGVQYRLR